MAHASSKISVCLFETVAYVKISGKADSVLSQEFKLLLSKLSDNPETSVVLNLAECLYMDSTFLGILARFANDRSQVEPKPARPAIVNASPKILELLDNLAVLSLFRVESIEKMKDIEYSELPSASGEWSKERRAEHCLEAHRTLAALSSENAGRFKDVVHFLEEDLAKSRRAAS